MKTGELDQLVYFESPVESNNEGSASTSWVDASGESPRAPDYAKVITERGAEAFEAARTQSIRNIRCMVRYRSDVKTNWRVEWEGDKYNITAVDPSNRRAGELWFTAELIGAT